MFDECIVWLIKLIEDWWVLCLYHQYGSFFVNLMISFLFRLQVQKIYFTIRNLQFYDTRFATLQINLPSLAVYLLIVTIFVGVASLFYRYGWLNPQSADLNFITELDYNLTSLLGIIFLILLMLWFLLLKLGLRL